MEQQNNPDWIVYIVNAISTLETQDELELVETGVVDKDAFLT